jgi:hypothetical protein
MWRDAVSSRAVALEPQSLDGPANVGPPGPDDVRPMVVRVVHGAFDKVTRPPILGFFAILYGLLVAHLGVRHIQGLTGPLSAEGDRVVTGDYLAFLTGAELLASGRGPSLYDLDVQATVQNDLAGMVLTEWQPYVNPPLLALSMRPLVDLPFTRGFALYSLAMTVAGILGGCALVGILPRLAGRRLDALTIFLLALSFHPIARTIFGGQNTVLTWALVTLSLWAIQRGHPILCGLVLGALSYKPQYVPFLVLVLVLSRAWVAVGVALGGIFLHYAAGALSISLDWPLRMMATMRVYRPMEWAANVDTHFSLVPFFDFAVGGVAAEILALLGIGAVLTALYRWAPRVVPGDDDFPLLWSMVLVGSMLASPHLQYYDFGVLVLPLCVALEVLLRRGRPAGILLRIVLGIVFVGYPMFYLAADRLHFQPLTLWMTALFGWLCWLAAPLRAAASSATGLPPAT